ncbi:MAG TPA: hypothetical protein VMF89_23775 [Polyangiales bacterium]|nr:hypothetical protein [Polyangiales bacterium]
MPRVYSQRVAYFALGAACAALAGCSSGAGPTLGVDRGSAIVPDDPSAAAQPDSRGEPIDGPEEILPVCQSQFFGADPLALEQSARSCSFALTSAVLNPANVVVEIAGQARAAGDAENGWQLLADGSTVLLLGVACDDVLAGADVELSALCE